MGKLIKPISTYSLTCSGGEMNRLNALLGFTLLSLMQACGGGGGGSTSSPSKPSPVKSIVYADPTDTTQWRFVQNAGSTPTLLKLDLLAPDGSSGRGVAMVLGPVPGGLSWSAPNGGVDVQNGGYTGALAQKASVQNGNLRILLSQVADPSRVYGSRAVLTVALALNANAKPGSYSLAASHCGHLTSSPTVEAFTPAIGQIQLQ